jgi:methylated-DNA-[protein]-cysteine S-methyltransferase
VVAAPFGAVAIASREGCITRIELLERGTPLPAADPVGARAAEQLAQYFVDPAAGFDVPLAFDGTPFQRAVWAAIAAIPAGRTRRYGDIAAELGSPARAVGQACGDNRLPLVIPCHRVVAASGLGGFAHATDGFAVRVKRWLLEHEGALRGELL